MGERGEGERREIVGLCDQKSISISINSICSSKTRSNNHKSTSNSSSRRGVVVEIVEWDVFIFLCDQYSSISSISNSRSSNISHQTSSNGGDAGGVDCGGGSEASYL